MIGKMAGFSLVRPIYRGQSLFDFPLNLVASALIYNQRMSLQSTCHNLPSAASAVERDSILPRHGLLRNCGRARAERPTLGGPA